MKQKDVDILFNTKFNNHGGEYITREYAEDIVRIQLVIYQRFKILVSSSEAVYFWEWRSECYCAGWLIIFSDDEIAEWFVKFTRDFYGPCEKCGDAGWVRWNELDEYDGPGIDDTKYTCDECEGRFADYE